MTAPAATRRAELLRIGFTLEWITLGWNIVGVVILAVLAFGSASVALAGFGLDCELQQ